MNEYGKHGAKTYQDRWGVGRTRLMRAGSTHESRGRNTKSDQMRVHCVNVRRLGWTSITGGTVRMKSGVICAGTAMMTFTGEAKTENPGG